MKSIKDIIKHTFEQKEIRKWNKIYWAIDLHDTVITGKYNRFNEGAEIFAHAKEVLDYLYNSDVHQTILWTSSWNDACQDILKRYDLKFNYFNENPECKSTDMCDFNSKFYFNILLDDKSGWVGSTDWTELKNALEEYDLNFPKHELSDAYKHKMENENATHYYDGTPKPWTAQF